MMSFIGAFLFLGAVGATPAPTQIQVQVGESHILAPTGIEEIVITSPEVLGYQQLPSGAVVITGHQPGKAEALTFKAGQLQQRFTFIVKRAPDKHLKLRLATLQRRFPQLQISDGADELIRLSGQLPAQAKADMKDLLARFPRLASQIEWLPPAPEPMLVLEVRIAEVKRSFARHIGVRWPGHVNGPLLQDMGNWLHLPLSAQTTLDIMEREGRARLLANPTLTAMSGGKADFLVGGEFPVPQVVAQGMQDVSFRPYGIQLEIAPKLLADQQVSATLVAELSSIDPATAVNGVPGLLSRRVSSTLTLPLGETLVLSGLIQHEQAQQADRFPELHKLPILGALFSSTQFRAAETDLIVMVTPRLAKLASAEQASLAEFVAKRERFQNAVGCVGLIEPFMGAGENTL
ncbi:type II and III secretion system protein family protein [Pseudidiomarina homiensis]|uniref:type II and III secretion system protein family protein n=1 Tax=Pseudidiomarina homiensis TaxID=364198 RepID=UPI00215B4ABF|nr:pilus assembly protein N-terminal domain-containing protein [Pseudidiomarina homiensis]